MPYVYRLESDWGNLWEDYFGNHLQYTCFRGIDQFEKHGLQIPLASGEDLCGLWILSEFSDAIKFQIRNTGGPPLSDLKNIEEINQNCINLLRRAGQTSGGIIRLPVRIDSAYFGDDAIYQDIPYVYECNSACFHIKKFNTNGKTYFKGTLSSDRVPSVFVPDEFVDVYFQGAWWRKSARIKEYIFGHIAKCGHVRDIILSPAAEHAPTADLSPTLVRQAAAVPPPPTGTAVSRSAWNRLCSWLRHR